MTIVPRPESHLASNTILAVVIVGALYFGRDLLIPIALAILLSFVLSPLVRRLRDWFLPRSVAVIAVVLVAFLAIFALGGVLAVQIGQLAGDLPQYQANIRTKIQALRGAHAASGPLERASGVLQDLSREINKPDEAPRDRGQASTRPVQVEVHQPPLGPLETLTVLIAPLLRPLATTGIVLIFVIFILLQQEDLRNRFIKLAGSRDLQKTTAALDEAGVRLGRLFLSQLALNTAFGIVIGLGLWAIGVPSPILWGILAGVLRFVPYIGAVVAAIFPLALALAVDPGWTMIMLTAGLFLVVEPLVGHVVEPLAYGHSSGLSPIAVVAAATFWTALWGPIGLVLATPVTICLVVIGRHVERLQFLEVMLGNEPPLSAPEMFYQRMLTGDPSEEIERAESVIREASLLDYYDQIALKGLELVQVDLSRGSLEAARAQRIADAVGELIDDLADEEDGVPAGPDSAESAADGSEPAAGPAALKVTPAGVPVLCIGTRVGLDEVAATMLAQLLNRHGIEAHTEEADALAPRPLRPHEAVNVALVCLSYLGTTASGYGRYAVRRARRRFPNAAIMLCCWASDADHAAMRQVTKADSIAATLRDAIEQCTEALPAANSPPTAALQRNLGAC